MTEVEEWPEAVFDGPVYGRITKPIRLAGGVRIPSGNVGRVLGIVDKGGMPCAIFLYRRPGRKTSKRALVPLDAIVPSGASAK